MRKDLLLLLLLLLLLVVLYFLFSESCGGVFSKDMNPNPTCFLGMNPNPTSYIFVAKLATAWKYGSTAHTHTLISQFS